jgi:Cd2+/Zn2+-exporting ATPase
MTEANLTHSHEEGSARSELVLAAFAGVMLALGYLIETSFPSLSFAAYLASYACGGCFTLREALENLRHRKFEIDTLMLVAAVGAAAIGAWAEGALLLFLFSLGHGLEHYALGRAKSAITALAKLAPENATIKRLDGTSETIPVAQLVPGDVLIIRPDERIPADGFVLSGVSAVDQSPITGESIPVDKQAVPDPDAARSNSAALPAEHRLFTGTINGGGLLEMEVTRSAGESTLARVVRMVSEAETRQSPSQRFTERFQSYFVPGVLMLVALLLLAWVVVDEPFRASFYRAMAVLVSASPCALAIATPSAVLSGIARAARSGVLIKGGAPLEELGSLDAMAFDKTGTLTQGKPRIARIAPVSGVKESDLMAVAMAVEQLSQHPLAQAIVRDGAAYLAGTPVPVATDLQSLTGRGISAKVDGEDVLIGKPGLFDTEDIAPLTEEAAEVSNAMRVSGMTTMIVRRAGRDLGAIGLMDTPRDHAREALDRLKLLGIGRMIMISGDSQRVAEAVARNVGITEAWGDLMPEDKVKAIGRLKEGTRVAMVGDGVNDAPAMASATVGIAMGAAGSDVALETADIALMSDDLRHLPFAVGLSRQTRGIIRQNLVVSLGVVGLLVPATILGLGIGPAVIAHEGSTLLVVFNALRLLAYKEK